jgi:hypothetical protein
MIEDKIKEYLKQFISSVPYHDKMAKDIAEICEAENTTLGRLLTESERYVSKLEKENKSLKDKLDKDRITNILKVRFTVLGNNIFEVFETIAKEIIGGD